METLTARRRYWLISVSDIEAFRWMTGNDRLAFPQGDSRRAKTLRQGDGVIIEIEAGALARHRRSDLPGYISAAKTGEELPGLTKVPEESQFAAVASVLSPVNALLPPVAFEQGRFSVKPKKFSLACEVSFEKVLREGSGVPERTIRDRLSFVSRREDHRPSKDWTLLKDQWRFALQQMTGIFAEISSMDFALLSEAIRSWDGRAAPSDASPA